jgi:hypothetical protein
LIADIVGKMPEKHGRFLVEFERGKPDWPLLALPAASETPGRQMAAATEQNLDKLSQQKRAGLVARLKEVLCE